jgi:hypothetical protein
MPAAVSPSVDSMPVASMPADSMIGDSMVVARSFPAFQAFSDHFGLRGMI